MALNIFKLSIKSYWVLDIENDNFILLVINFGGTPILFSQLLEQIDIHHLWSSYSRIFWGMHTWSRGECRKIKLNLNYLPYLRYRELKPIYLVDAFLVSFIQESCKMAIFLNVFMVSHRWQKDPFSKNLQRFEKRYSSVIFVPAGQILSRSSVARVQFATEQFFCHGMRIPSNSL